MEPRRLTVMPPCKLWPQGRYDSAIFVHNSNNATHLPGVGLHGRLLIGYSNLDISCSLLGFTVAQIQLILHSIWDVETDTPLYLVYTQQFNIVHQLTTNPPTCAAIPDPVTGLYTLKCALCTNQTNIGAIIPLSHCRMPVQLVPHFGAKATTSLTCVTSMERSREFFLNGYFDKDIFQYLCNSHP